MQFQQGNKLGKGRPLKHSTVIKRFIEKYPHAYEELMEAEYKRGMDANSMSAQYVIEGIKGKIGVTVDLTVGVLPYDTAIKAIETAAERELLDAPKQEETAETCNASVDMIE